MSSWAWSRRSTCHSRRLLVLDVDRARAQREDFDGRQQLVALLRIVVEEELEAGELHGLIRLARRVGVELEPRLTPAVHVDDDLHARVELNLIRFLEHVQREAV